MLPSEKTGAYVNLRISGDIKSRDSRFLQGVLLVYHFLIHFCYNLLIHHSLLLPHTNFQSLMKQHTSISKPKSICNNRDWRDWNFSTLPLVLLAGWIWEVQGCETCMTAGHLCVFVQDLVWVLHTKGMTGQTGQQHLHYNFTLRACSKEQGWYLREFLIWVASCF